VPEERIQIGGWVLKNSDGSPIPGATVTRVDTGAVVQTDSQGRFVFIGLLPGIHSLQASAAGFAAITRDLDVPAGPPADHVFRLS
jgi:hypothetical protein